MQSISCPHHLYLHTATTGFGGNKVHGSNQIHGFKYYKYQVVARTHSGRDSEFEIDQDKARQALKKLDQQLQSISDKPINPPKIRGHHHSFLLLHFFIFIIYVTCLSCKCLLCSRLCVSVCVCGIFKLYACNLPAVEVEEYKILFGTLLLERLVNTAGLGSGLGFEILIPFSCCLCFF